MIAATEDLVALRETLRRFVNAELRPIIGEYEAKQRFPMTVAREMGALGCFGAGLPEEVGGSGLGKMGQALVIEELSHSSGGIAATTLVQFLSILPIWAHGTPEQQQQYLEPAILGEKMAAIAVTEPNHGSDVAGIETVAVPDGKGYRIKGQKMFITNSPFSDFMVVAAKTDPNERHHGISLFLVDSNAPGLTIGSHLNKLGWWTSETAPVYFDNCWVPTSRMIGEAGHGFYYIMEDFNYERLLLSASSIGLADEAHSVAIEYAVNRSQFGVAISEFQAVRHKLAQMAVQIEAGRQLLRHAATIADEHEDFSKVASIAKYFCGEMVNAVAYDAIQVLGGAGYLQDHPLERIYRDARIMTIGGGTSEVQLNIIAKRLGL